jgi:hypothetical protein
MTKHLTKCFIDLRRLGLAPQTVSELTLDHSFAQQFTCRHKMMGMVYLSRTTRCSYFESLGKADAARTLFAATLASHSARLFLTVQ